MSVQSAAASVAVNTAGLNKIGIELQNPDVFKHPDQLAKLNQDLSMFTTAIEMAAKVLQQEDRADKTIADILRG